MQDRHATHAPSIERLLDTLMGFCDGAKKRDGTGFNKADSQDGARLAAMWRRGLPWSEDDLARAEALVKRYAHQAAFGFETQDRAAAARLERAIRNGHVASEKQPVTHETRFDYVQVSPGGREAYVVILGSSAHYMDMVSDIKALSALRHGARRTRVRFKKSVPMTINGRRRRVKRWEMDLHGTSRKGLLDLADRWGLVVDPALQQDPDPHLDALMRHPRICFHFEGVRRGRSGAWFVFDLEQPHPPFSQDIKHLLKGLYVCERGDDWNWYVPLCSRTLTVIAELIKKHGFVCDRYVASILGLQKKG